MTTELLTETEAARVLRLAVTTLRRWRYSGRGPVWHKIGHLVRYDAAELREYIAHNTRRSTRGCGVADAGCGAHQLNAQRQRRDGDDDPRSR